MFTASSFCSGNKVLESLLLRVILLIDLVLTLHWGLFPRECTRGGFCNFMHLKPISRELRRELYGRRRKRYRNLFRTFDSVILVRMLSQTRLSPPGTALVHAPENAVPAPGTDGGIAKDDGRGTESVTDGSENAPTDPRVSPRPSPRTFPSCDDTFTFLSFIFLLDCCKCFLLFSFLRQASVSFSIKQICNSAARSPHSYGNWFWF